MIKKLFIVLIVFAVFGFTSNNNSRPKAEIAFCLDLSGSTNGLLDDVRDNLWHLVNYFQRTNPETELRIAFVGFSRGSFGLENGYVNILSDLTSNYDYISFQLFSMVSCVEKGDQFVGAALKASVHELSWSKDKNSKKIILLFGNSRADLGMYDYNKPVEAAVQKGITINSVYCVRQTLNPKDLPQWYSIADRTGGQLFTYRVTRRTPLKFRSEKTEELIEINNSLNDTYLPYDKKGRQFYDLMIAADVNSLQMNERFFYSRMQTKLSSGYRDYLSSFDLVDFVKKNDKLPPFDRQYFPKDLAKVQPSELFEIAKIKAERRENIIDKLETRLVDAQLDPFSVNPIDSIFIESISRKLFN